MNQLVVLVADEVQRVSWSAADHTDARAQCKQRRHARRVDRIQFFDAESQRHQQYQCLPLTVRSAADVLDVLQIH